MSDSPIESFDGIRDESKRLRREIKPNQVIQNIVKVPEGFRSKIDNKNLSEAGSKLLIDISRKLDKLFEEYELLWQFRTMHNVPLYVDKVIEFVNEIEVIVTELFSIGKIINNLKMEGVSIEVGIYDIDKVLDVAISQSRYIDSRVKEFCKRLYLYYEQIINTTINRLPARINKAIGENVDGIQKQVKDLSTSKSHSLHTLDDMSNFVGAEIEKMKDIIATFYKLREFIVSKFI